VGAAYETDEKSGIAAVPFTVAAIDHLSPVEFEALHTAA